MLERVVRTQELCENGNELWCSSSLHKGLSRRSMLDVICSSSSYNQLGYAQIAYVFICPPTAPPDKLKLVLEISLSAHVTSFCSY